MRALVADDDASIRSMIALILELEGFEVDVAADGAEAVRRARLAHPDVVVLDVMMPGVDGFEAAAMLRADPELHAVPIVFCTAMGNVDAGWRGWELGAAAYVSKPFETEVLVTEVLRAARPSVASA